MPPYINAIGTATPSHDIHPSFLAWARERVSPREMRLFDRMAARAGIEQRWSVLTAEPAPIGPDGFYGNNAVPGTAERMAIYAQAAPGLAVEAIERLAKKVPLGHITHLVVASCTGFVAPGIDQIIARRLGLAFDVERLLIGFMGCYAAVAALRSARHIVRSVPHARVLVITVELSTLHMQPDTTLEPLLAQLQFGDGAAAALVTADPAGFSLDETFAAALPHSDDLIRWTITDQGFVMHLSGAVPNHISSALAEPALRASITGGVDPATVDGWAVHAGGRSILDAVEHAFALAPDALAASRAVLRTAGNMSSATLMFVLERLLAGPPVREGRALAFGPGLAAEGFAFRSAA
ncbi:type III polyketide synthase [Sphingomonas aerophila]|uniref:type III polyketide synthase n=1 Tax=Sphingomonas aerophila TaxID=1344948 RepID=UPI001608D397